MALSTGIGVIAVHSAHKKDQIHKNVSKYSTIRKNEDKIPSDSLKLVPDEDVHANKEAEIAKSRFEKYDDTPLSGQTVPFEKYYKVIMERNYLQKKILAMERKLIYARINKDVATLRSGCIMRKYHSKSDVHEYSMRFVQVSKDFTKVEWGHVGARMTKSVETTEIRGLLFGHRTETFRKCLMYNPNFITLSPPWSCFSIVTNQRTVDFSCDPDILVSWVIGLQALLPPENLLIYWTRHSLIGKRAWMKFHYMAKQDGRNPLQYFLYMREKSRKTLLGETKRKERNILNVLRSTKPQVFEQIYEKENEKKDKKVINHPQSNSNTSTQLSENKNKTDNKKLQVSHQRYHTLSRIDQIKYNAENQMLRECHGNTIHEDHSIDDLDFKIHTPETNISFDPPKPVEDLPFDDGEKILMLDSSDSEDENKVNNVKNQNASKDEQSQKNIDLTACSPTPYPSTNNNKNSKSVFKKFLSSQQQSNSSPTLSPDSDIPIVKQNSVKNLKKMFNK